MDGWSRDDCSWWRCSRRQPRCSRKPATLTDDAHTSPNAQLQAANHDGNGSEMIVAGRAAGQATAYVKFSVTSGLPDGTTEEQVAKATLKLYVSGLSVASALTVARVTGAWTEHSLTPDTVLTLTPEVPGIVLTRAQTFVTIDLTQLVRDWISGRQPNDGLALVAASDGSFISFDTKESPFTSHEPALEIALVAGGSGGPAGPQGPQGPAGDIGPPGPEGRRGQPARAGRKGRSVRRARGSNRTSRTGRRARPAGAELEGRLEWLGRIRRR